MNDLSPTVTTGPLPASRRVWQAGVLHPEIRVPMREIGLHPTADEPPVTVYDSSGPYTDPRTEIAIDRGLPRLRENLVAVRGDTVTYEGRHVKPEDNGFAGGERLVPEYPVHHAPRRATDGRAVTQMAYARQIMRRHSDFASGAQTDLLADADDDVVMQRQAQNRAAFLNFLRH